MQLVVAGAPAQAPAQAPGPTLVLAPAQALAQAPAQAPAQAQAGAAASPKARAPQQLVEWVELEEAAQDRAVAAAMAQGLEAVPEMAQAAGRKLQATATAMRRAVWPLPPAAGPRAALQLAVLPAALAPALRPVLLRLAVRRAGRHLAPLRGELLGEAKALPVQAQVAPASPVRRAASVAGTASGRALRAAVAGSCDRIPRAAGHPP